MPKAGFPLDEFVREWNFFVAKHAQIYISNVISKLRMLSNEKLRFARTNSSSGNQP